VPQGAGSIAEGVGDVNPTASIEAAIVSALPEGADRDGGSWS
jgi:hypothetical protein